MRAVQAVSKLVKGGCRTAGGKGRFLSFTAFVTSKVPLLAYADRFCAARTLGWPDRVRASLPRTKAGPTPAASTVKDFRAHTRHPFGSEPQGRRQPSNVTPSSNLRLGCSESDADR